MACTISLSDRPEDVWMIRNELFRKFVRLVERMHPEAGDLNSRLHEATLTNGLSLDSVWLESAQEALRCREVLCRVSRSLSNGSLSLEEDEAVVTTEKPRHAERFYELASLLEQWRPETAA